MLQTANAPTETPRIPAARNQGGRPRGSRPGRLDKTELELLLGRLLKSQDTPVQYKAALASNLASLKAWNKHATDESIKYHVCDELRRWARERVYGAGAESADSLLAAARATLPQDERTPAGEGAGAGGATSALLSQPDAQAAGIPQRESQTEPLIPSHTATTPENSPLTVANKGDKPDGQG